MTLSNKAPSQPGRAGWHRLLHNPWLLDPSEFLRGFVLRQDVLSELVAFIREVPTDGKVTHLLLTGGRGMGKTTLLRRLALFVEQDAELSQRWIPLSFSEEPYEIGDVADWLHAALRGLAVALGDATLARVPSDGEVSAVASRTSLASALYARLLAACSSAGKRPLLLCDSFDMLLAQIGPKEQRLLCRLLRSDPRALVVGGALGITREFERASPLLPMFQLRPLAPLTEDEHLHLLDRLATWNGDAASRAELAEHPERARRFYSLTGGNPRITAVLYRILSETASQALDLRRDLELLLDELTPLYKAQIDQLSPQQRRICDVLARTWNPLSLAELSSRLRLSGNTITSQLCRLRAQGYIVASESGARLRYSLAERLFNIFWLMRSSGEAHCNLRWISLFLQSFFSQDQLREVARQLGQDCGQSHEPPSSSSGPNDRFVYLASLTSALDDPRQRLASLTSALSLAERVSEAERHRAVSATLDELLSTVELGTSSGIELDALRSALERVVTVYPMQARAWFLLACVCTLQGDLSQASAVARHAIECTPRWLAPHLLLTQILDRQGDMTAAHAAAEQAVSCDPQSSRAWSLLGHIRLFCHHEIGSCVEALSRAAQVDSQNGSRWRILSVALFECSRFAEAMPAVRRAVQLEPQNPLNWAVLAVLSYVGGVGSKIPPPDAALESRFEPWFLVRALYYRLFDILGPPVSGGLDGASVRSAVEHPWRHWAAVYVPRWLLRDVEGLLVQELLRDPSDALLRGSLALLLGRQGKWSQAFQEARGLVQAATPELLQAYHHILFGLFLLAGSCGQASETVQLLSEHPALVHRQSALMAALEQQATGQRSSLDSLSREERAVAEVFVRCMQQVATIAQHPLPRELRGPDETLRGEPRLPGRGIAG